MDLCGVLYSVRLQQVAGHRVGELDLAVLGGWGLLADYGLAESLTSLQSDGGERFQALVILLLWLDNREAGLATVEALLKRGFHLDLPTEDGTLKEEIEAQSLLTDTEWDRLKGKSQ